MSQPKQLLLVAQVDFRLAVHGMRSYVQHALARNQRKQRMAYRRKRRVGSDGSHALKAPYGLPHYSPNGELPDHDDYSPASDIPTCRCYDTVAR